MICSNELQIIQKYAIDNIIGQLLYENYFHNEKFNSIKYHYIFLWFLGIVTLSIFHQLILIHFSQLKLGDWISKTLFTRCVVEIKKLIMIINYLHLQNMILLKLKCGLITIITFYQDLLWIEFCQCQKYNNWKHLIIID